MSILFFIFSSRTLLAIFEASRTVCDEQHGQTYVSTCRNKQTSLFKRLPIACLHEALEKDVKKITSLTNSQSNFVLMQGEKMKFSSLYIHPFPYILNSFFFCYIFSDCVGRHFAVISTNSNMHVLDV